MRKFFSHTRWILTGLFIAVLSACSTMKHVDYNNEDFTSSNTYSQVFPGSGAEACEAARRALLSQGYVINSANAALVNGSKNFQPDSNVHLQVHFHVVCAPNGAGSNSTTVFANAVRDRYSLKKSSNSASVGVGVIGSLSLPIGSIEESLVKVASETIPSKTFYERFFERVESYLDATAIDLAIEGESEKLSQKDTEED